MKRDVIIEPGDMKIIRNFLKAKVDGYSEDWTDNHCVDELTNWLYYNT